MNEELQRLRKEKPTEEFTVEGVGSIKVYGNLDVEKLVKKLLQNEKITGA
jgi:hypothetical protein